MTTAVETLPEIWGGIECTINRVGDQYFDQAQLCDLYGHPEFLNAVIGTGIQKMRFPILWEKHQPTASGKIDFTATAITLNKLAYTGVTPIAGLLHHGSGPAFTDLLQPDFPEKFAAYAEAVARRFPWLEWYTPVNEPLTTARFSGLYGHWYPHKKNDAAFIRMLLNELKGTVLAMEAIRRINPAAKLVQTEDLSKTYSTPLLAYQAKFENHRRWLTYDILTGKFTAQHPLWDYFMRLGILPETMHFFSAHPTPPDVMGFNYYLTSERYLDENIEAYPMHTHGSNSIHTYADVESARVEMNVPSGLELLLTEAWERYHLPMAITEAHLHCTREDQLRWFRQIYDASVILQRNGIPVIAVTSWAMLGSFGWNKLLTEPPFDYETGCFDVSCGYARPTALAALVTTLATQNTDHAALTNGSGWWQRSNRFLQQTNNMKHSSEINDARPIVIIGKTGTLGSAFARVCHQRNIPHVLLTRQEADITDITSLEKMTALYQPWAIINAAGYVQVEGAEKQRQQCFQTNGLGVKNLALLCKQEAIALVCFSSDMVFNGLKGSPYVESDPVAALNVYGQSKIMAENFLSAHYPQALMIRTSAFFGPWDEHNFIAQLFTSLQKGEKFPACYDLVVSPTYVPHLVNAALDLLIDETAGIIHLASKGSITWYEFAKKAALAAGLDHTLIQPVASSGSVKQPAFAALGSEKISVMPTLDIALREYLHQVKISVL